MTLRNVTSLVAISGLVCLAGCGPKEDPAPAATPAGGTSATSAADIQNNPNIPPQQKDAMMRAMQAGQQTGQPRPQGAAK